MKNIRELGRNALVIAGLLTAGVSLGDSFVTSANDKENQAFMSTRAELRGKYSVKTVCASGGGPFETYCTDYIAGVDESDESRILNDYYEELDEKVSDIPPDMAARRRYKRDATGFFSGSLIAAIASRKRTVKE